MSAPGIVSFSPSIHDYILSLRTLAKVTSCSGVSVLMWRPRPFWSTGWRSALSFQSAIGSAYE